MAAAGREFGGLWAGKAGRAGIERGWPSADWRGLKFSVTLTLALVLTIALPGAFSGWLDLSLCHNECVYVPYSAESRKFVKMKFNL